MASRLRDPHLAPGFHQGLGALAPCAANPHTPANGLSRLSTQVAPILSAPTALRADGQSSTTGRPRHSRSRDLRWAEWAAKGCIGERFRPHDQGGGYQTPPVLRSERGADEAEA